ncbi:hypothetical protein CSUI_008828, partial [Cystoisospora suis]
LVFTSVREPGHLDSLTLACMRAHRER